VKPLLISSGEPAGVGPDLCLALASSDKPLVIIGDPHVLKARAEKLDLQVSIHDHLLGNEPILENGHLNVLSVTCPTPVDCGQLSVRNAPYVMELLTRSAQLCGAGYFSALVTAPVHKGIINQYGIPFTGHTEFFAEYFNAPSVVMMLCSSQMKVALVTTHLPLHQVANAITSKLIFNVISQLNNSLINDFGLNNPKIKVAGLNPHAGEGGYLGREEIEVIEPALKTLLAEGLNVEGPLPADTLFITEHLKECDAIVAMYHDQGLPVLKYAGFHEAVNVTLGLPIIRTSVDHGTALNLAGKNQLHPGSMIAAVELAYAMASTRAHYED